MLIGVVSDTHGHVENTLRGVRMLETFEIAEVLHCGDIGSASIVKLFEKWPTHFVLGNVDSNANELKTAIADSGQRFHGRFGNLHIHNRKIALVHSDDEKRFRQTLDSGEWELVCYGHTHQSKQHLHGRTLVLNPGALYRARQHSVAIVNLATMCAEIVTV